MPYPCVSRAEDGCERLEAAGGSELNKIVSVKLEPLLDDPAQIAALALTAARAGASVLVVRNTVAAAVEVFEHIRAAATSDEPILFRVRDLRPCTAI